MGVLTIEIILGGAATRRSTWHRRALVDSYRVACRPVRDVLVRYLDQRRPAYGLLLVSRRLSPCWSNCSGSTSKSITPVSTSLHLPPEVAEAWKQRLRVVESKAAPSNGGGSTSPILVTCSQFLSRHRRVGPGGPDLGRMGSTLPDPARRNDGLGKKSRRYPADMHQRVRERLPHLDAIVDAAEDQRRSTTELLDRATATPVGETFGTRGSDLSTCSAIHQRTRGAAHGIAQSHACSVSTPPKSVTPLRPKTTRSGRWAIVETLRHTGIRLEELLELTQLAVVQYRTVRHQRNCSSAPNRAVQERRGTRTADRAGTGQRAGSHHHPASPASRRQNSGDQPIRPG